MFEPKRILVPRATLARHGGMADLALDFAGRFDSEVFLLRVDLDSGGGFENYLWSLSADEAANREAAMSGTDPAESTPEGEAGLHLDRAARKPAAAAILEFAEQHEIDLIMMAAHTHSVLGRSVFGGVQSEVVRWSPCPVLTGRREQAAELAQIPFRRLLVPVDFSSYAIDALGTARQIAAKYGAEVFVLHVQEERVLPRFTEKGLTRAAVPSDPGYIEEADEALRALVAESGGTGVAVTCHTVSGLIAGAINTFATNNNIDLVVISSKGLTDDPEADMGRSAERIVRRSPCPVLTLK